MQSISISNLSPLQGCIKFLILGALNGLHKMESGCEGGLEATLTTDMELAEIGSPHGSLGGSPLPHHDLEDSETEAVWSDGDLNIMGGS